MLEVVDTNKVTRELLEDNMVMAEMEEEFGLGGEGNELKPKPKLRGVSSRRIKKGSHPQAKEPYQKDTPGYGSIEVQKIDHLGKQT